MVVWEEGGPCRLRGRVDVTLFSTVLWCLEFDAFFSGPNLVILPNMLLIFVFYLPPPLQKDPDEMK